MCESVVVIVWTIGRKFFASRFQLIIHSGCISRRSDTGRSLFRLFPFFFLVFFFDKSKRWACLRRNFRLLAPLLLRQECQWRKTRTLRLSRPSRIPEDDVIIALGGERVSQGVPGTLRSRGKRERELVSAFIFTEYFHFGTNAGPPPKSPKSQNHEDSRPKKESEQGRG